MGERRESKFMLKVFWPVMTAVIASGICFMIWQMWDIGLALADMKKEIKVLQDENEDLKIEITSRNRAQWSLLREISSDIRDQHIDVQYVKTIQATVVLPNLLQQRMGITQEYRLQEKKKELRKLSETNAPDIDEFEKRLESSKVMRKGPLEGDLDHYIQQQIQEPMGK